MNFVGYCVFSTNDTQLRDTDEPEVPLILTTNREKINAKWKTEYKQHYTESQANVKKQRNMENDIKENTAIRNKDAGAINKSTNDNENNNNDAYNGNDNRRRKLNIGKHS
ncbi:hypothetical protein DPMN_170457 [Dreissena polymorpha]|uniref:Uncharacterized protein n=1 Tax=Dreissena polymorpha TaxID=45954 RepID=A0A9D4DXC8_DREPO|nr:hypothetical protein DPMN_170457 [Dreissena polymorpha]